MRILILVLLLLVVLRKNPGARYIFSRKVELASGVSEIPPTYMQYSVPNAKEGRSDSFNSILSYAPTECKVHIVPYQSSIVIAI